jgi:hypothetical protein
MMLRIQRERLAGVQLATDADYHAAWGLTSGGRGCWIRGVWCCTRGR